MGPCQQPQSSVSLLIEVKSHSNCLISRVLSWFTTSLVTFLISFIVVLLPFGILFFIVLCDFTMSSI